MRPRRIKEAEENKRQENKRRTKRIRVIGEYEAKENKRPNRIKRPSTIRDIQQEARENMKLGIRKN